MSEKSGTAQPGTQAVSGEQPPMPVSCEQPQSSGGHTHTITPEEVEHIAQLSRLSLREGDRERFGSQLSDIIGYVDTVRKLDTGGIDPTFLTAPLFNVLRKDEPRPSLTREEVLSNAPEQEGPYFKLPRILTNEGTIDI